MEKEIQKQMKGSKGITLIALVVTIVVLLILAGITISTLFGDNGIITAARKAAEETEKSEKDTEKGLENLINDMELATWAPTDPKYFTYTLDESTKTATITGVKEQYQVKAYYHNRELSKYDYVTAIKTESGEYITDIAIPSNIKEKEKTYIVTAIGNVAFGTNIIDFGYNDSSYTIDKAFTSFKIPSSVTSIGDSAFSYCTGLTSITIPSSVTSIGDSAFSYCTGLTSITIPNSVTSIGQSTFGGCSSLTSITILSGVTSIGQSTFGGCSSLASITIPSSVTSIGRSAFNNCSSLTSITIPNSVTNIGGYVFWCNRSITVTVPFAEGNTPSGWSNAWNSGGNVTVKYQQ